MFYGYVGWVKYFLKLKGEFFLLLIGYLLWVNLLRIVLDNLVLYFVIFILLFLENIFLIDVLLKERF